MCKVAEDLSRSGARATLALLLLIAAACSPYATAVYPPWISGFPWGKCVSTHALPSYYVVFSGFGAALQKGNYTRLNFNLLTLPNAAPQPANLTKLAFPINTYCEGKVYNIQINNQTVSQSYDTFSDVEISLKLTGFDPIPFSYVATLYDGIPFSFDVPGNIGSALGFLVNPIFAAFYKSDASICPVGDIVIIPGS